MINTGPIKLGIVGLGRAGAGMHCPELESRKDMFQIVAVCDIIEERRNKMAEKYGCSAYQTIEELVANPEVEMVAIATRSIDHFRHGKVALEAGKDVFMEKPMCCTYTEALELKEIAENSRGKLYIRHNRRFEPGFQHIREIMVSGILGEVYEIKLRRVGYQRRDDWQTLKEFGGGQLLNWGPHIIDHGLQFLDSPLKGIWSDLKRIAAVGDAEDHIKIILTGENGRIIDIEISGGAAISEPEYLLWGTKGALSCDGNTIKLKYLDPNIVIEPRQPDPGTPGASFGTPETLKWIEETVPVSPAKKVDMTMIWDELYNAVRKGATFPITLDQAVEVMRVISMAKKGTPFE